MSKPGKSITVKASGSLKQQVAPGTVIQNVDTVGEAMAHLNLSEPGELMLLVNGRIAYWQTALEDGDILQLVPAVSGGRT